MEEFNELICLVFSIQEESKALYKEVLWKAAKNKEHPMFHWVARKQGKVVSAVSTLVEADMVSFWNGASLPEVRRQGLSTALGYFALRSTSLKACRIASSYLTKEALAFGICSSLGGETKWRFNAFLSPSKK